MAELALVRELRRARESDCGGGRVSVLDRSTRSVVPDTPTANPRSDGCVNRNEIRSQAQPKLRRGSKVVITPT